MSSDSPGEVRARKWWDGVWTLTVLVLWMSAVCFPVALILGVTTLVWGWGGADLFGYPIKTPWEFIFYTIIYGAGASLGLSYVLSWRKRAARPQVRRTYMILAWLVWPLVLTGMRAAWYGSLLEGQPVNRVTLRFADARTGQPLHELEVHREWMPMKFWTSDGTMDVTVFGYDCSTVSASSEGYRSKSVRVDYDTPRRLDVALEPLPDSDRTEGNGEASLTPEGLQTPRTGDGL